jgi:2-hydroxychromene-2-carboxylate isomerase
MRRERHLAEVSGLKFFAEVAASDAAPAHKIVCRNENAAVMARAAASPAFEAIELTAGSVPGVLVKRFAHDSNHIPFAAMSDVSTVEFFFDIGSPYSYLAATQLKALSERSGVHVRWRPFLLGGVFKASGNDMPARVAAKASYMLQDLSRWATLYDVPFDFPPIFPLNALRTQRVLAAVGKHLGEAAVSDAALALFEAYWVRGKDVSHDDVIRLALDAIGMDAAALLSAADSSDVKDALRASTEEAVARGAFGAPTMFVGDAMFFGNDRLPLLERHLSR